MKNAVRWLAAVGLLCTIQWFATQWSPAEAAAQATTPGATAGVSVAAISPPSGATVQGAGSTAAVAKPHDDTALGQQLFDQNQDGSQHDPFCWAIHVYKARHRIEVYYKNQLFRTYHAVFGRSGLTGGKQWEGDSRTPEGSYLIVAKRLSARFDWFLKLNYPNATDEQRFAAMRASHDMPAWRHEGGLIGIHGTDSPILNITDTNWTLGCISVSNPDIEEMARLLPVGTLVVINP
jgi:murein L,D-transpeptidase YafK